MTRDLGDENLKQAALGVYYQVAQMMKTGKSRADIEQALMAQGVRLETARIMIERLIESQIRVTRRSGRRNLALGLVLVGLGMLMVSGGPSGNPVQGAGVIFAWLSIVIGIFWLLHGAMQLRGAARLERAH